MRRLLRDPLLHFLLLGASLFAAFGLRNDLSTADEKSIVVTQGKIQQIVDTFVLTSQRPPTEQELKSQIDKFASDVKKTFGAKFATALPNGRHVVSGSWDHTLRVWDLATGETTKTLQGHTGSVSAVAVTPDGRHVISGSWDHTLRVWDLATGETTKTLQGHTESVSAVAVTPDGRHVVSGSKDSTLRVWDLATGETTKTLQGHTESVSAVAVTPDERCAVSSSRDHTLRVWDLRRRGKPQGGPGPYRIGHCPGNHTQWSLCGLRLLGPHAARLGFHRRGKPPRRSRAIARLSLPLQSRPMVATRSPVAHAAPGQHVAGLGPGNGRNHKDAPGLY